MTLCSSFAFFSLCFLTFPVFRTFCYLHDRLRAVHFLLVSMASGLGEGIHFLGTELSGHRAAHPLLDLQKTWLPLAPVCACVCTHVDMK